MHSNFNSNFTYIRLKREINIIYFLFFISFILTFGRWTESEVLNGKEVNKYITAAFLLFHNTLIFLYLLIKNEIKKYLINFKYYKKIGLVFLLNLLITMLFRENTLESIRFTIGVILSLNISLFLSYLITKIKLNDAIFIFSKSLIFILTLATIKHLEVIKILEPFNHNGTVRLGGLIFYGEYALITGSLLIIFLIGLNKCRKHYYKLLYISSFMIFSYLILCTDTRSAIFSFLLSSVILIFVRNYHKFSKFFTILIILFFSMIVYITLLSKYDIYQIQEDTFFRNLIWVITINGILKEPFTGYGNFNYLLSSNEALVISEKLGDAHSSILGHALNFGIPSLLIFLFFYYSVFKRIIKYANEQYKELVVLLIYWFIAPFFWGATYLLKMNITTICLLIILLGIMNHRDVYNKNKVAEDLFK